MEIIEQETGEEGVDTLGGDLPAVIQKENIDMSASDILTVTSLQEAES
jgi:hypothetical protein